MSREPWTEIKRGAQRPPKGAVLVIWLDGQSPCRDSVYFDGRRYTRADGREIEPLYWRPWPDWPEALRAVTGV